MAGSNRMAKSKTEELKTLDEALETIPVNMRIFTLCMRSLYSDQSVGSGSVTARKTSKLRDDTRKDAMVYVKGFLALSTSLVGSIRDFFEYYGELNVDEWKENLSDILYYAKGYRQCCTEVMELHQSIVFPLKERRDEAIVLMEELTQLSAQYGRKKRALEASADTKRDWAVSLAFVPGVNVVATPIFAATAYNDRAEAVAKDVQRQVHESAAIVIEKTMIPALATFIGGVEDVAGFFTVIENEMVSFQNKGEKAGTTKRLHYIMMKRKAESIRNSCQRFYAIVPGVRTDLLCIPNSGTDDNNVDKWLKKQRKDIEKRYGVRLTGHMEEC